MNYKKLENKEYEAENMVSNVVMEIYLRGMEKSKISNILIHNIYDIYVL